MIGSAWLSVTLAGIWSDYRSNATKYTNAYPSVRQWTQDWGPRSLWEHLVPLGVITVGLALRLNALTYSRVAEAYADWAHRAIPPTPAPASAQAAELGTGSRFKRWVRRLLG